MTGLRRSIGPLGYLAQVIPSRRALGTSQAADLSDALEQTWKSPCMKATAWISVLAHSRRPARDCDTLLLGYLRAQ